MCGDDRAGTGFRVDLQLAADERGAFAHADEPEPSESRLMGDQLRIEADAVVLDHRDHALVAVFDDDGNVLRLGVAINVRQRFLHDREYIRLHVARQPQLLDGARAQAEADRRLAGLPFRDELLQRGAETVFLEQTRTQTERDVMDGAAQLHDGILSEGERLSPVLRKRVIALTAPRANVNPVSS